MPTPASSPGTPPPIRKPRAKILMLCVAGAVMASVVLLVAYNIDKQNRQTPNAAPPPNLTELVTPEKLDPSETTGDLRNLSRNVSELGATNTWIQTTKDGKLSQQYRFASHDPSPEGLPAGWSQVNQPEIQVFLSNSRVLTLQSETAMLRAPSRTIESGKMTGNVIIRVFELNDAGQFDPANSTPVLDARTAEASFDNVQGEVRADGAVDLQTTSMQLLGSRLRVQVNEVADRVEWLRMDKVKSIRLSALQAKAGQNQSPSVAAAADQNGDPIPSAADAESPAPRVADEPPPSSPSTSPTNATEPQPSKQSQPPRKAGPVFYHLTLRRNVHIQQKGDAADWTAEGDDLHLYFSPQSKTMLGPRATTTAMLDDRGWLNEPLAANGALQFNPAMVAAMALAAMDDASASHLFQRRDDDIVINCEGGITMVPLTNPRLQPHTPDDARLELVGSPVKLRDNLQAVDVRCRTLEYQTAAQRVSLKGSKEFPLAFGGPDFIGAGDRMWLSRATRAGAFEGEGWMVMREHKAGAASEPTPALAEDAGDVRIQWQDRVDLAFDPAKTSGESAQESIGKLRSAAFAGNVEVNTTEIFMRADKMTAEFPPDNDAAAQRSIDRITAAGAVRALSMSDQGSLACDSLDLRFVRAKDGRTAPSKMMAAGNVAAIDKGHQTVWSEQLDIAFQPPERVSSASADQRSPTARVKTLTATRNVQVLLADGARAFAEHLFADADNEIVTLDGPNLMVVSDRAMMQGGQRLELHKSTNSAQWPGAGEFAYFTSSIVPNSDERIARPNVNQIAASGNAVQTRATWQNAMTYDGNVNDGAGAITLSGRVHGQSWPSSLEENTLDSQALTLQFIHDQSEAATNSAGESGGNLTAMTTAGKRRLKTLIADGDARLECHSWLMPDHSDVSRVFYIEGPKILYDDQTLEASVPGQGVLLVRDERPDENAANEHAGPLAFSAKGATKFSWKDHLQMTHLDGAMYAIDMVGDVAVQHLATDQSVSTITGNQLSATVERMAQNAGQRNATIDLGGSMEIRKISGLGSLFIRTPTRTVDCESFEYDYAARTATIGAKPGRYVTVMTAGSPNPLRAERVIWDVANDKVTATSVRGTTPR